MTIQELGQRVKAKYPEYSDLDDARVGESVVEKHPIYKDLLTASPEQQESVESDLLTKSASMLDAVFGGGKLGEALGVSFAAIREISKGNYDQARQILDTQVSPLELGGSVAKSVITAGSLALPGAGGVVQAAKQFAGLGAAAGAAQTLAGGGDLKEAARAAFSSGLASGVVGGAIGGIATLAGKLTTGGARSTYSNSLKVLARLKEAGKDPSKVLIERGIWGNLGTLTKSYKEGARNANALITQKIAPSKAVISSAEILDDAVQILQKRLGLLYTPKQLKSIIEKLPVAELTRVQRLGAAAELTPISQLAQLDKLPVAQANKVRQQIDNLLGDPAFIRSFEDLPVKARALRGIRTALATKVKALTGTSKEFAELSHWLNTEKVVARAAGIADAKFGLGLLDLISSAGGFGAGFLGGEGTTGERLARGVVGGTIGIGAERLARSTALGTGVAVLLDRIGKIPVDSAGKVSKTAITQLIGRIFAPSEGATPNQ